MFTGLIRMLSGAALLAGILVSFFGIDADGFHVNPDLVNVAWKYFVLAGAMWGSTYLPINGA